VPRPDRRSFLRLAGLGAALLTAGCPGQVGETEPPAGTPTDTTISTETRTETSTPTPTPTETPTPEPACADEPLPGQGTDAWPQAGSDPWHSNANLASDPLPADPAVQWIQRSVTRGPLVADGRLFVLGEDAQSPIQTLAPHTGAVENTYDAPPSDVAPPGEWVWLAGVVGRLVLLQGWRSILAYDIATGRREWRYTLPKLFEDEYESDRVDDRTHIVAATVANDALYLGTYRMGYSEGGLEDVSAVVAVSLDDRSERWRQFLKPPDIGTYGLWRIGYEQLFVSDSRVFVQSGGDLFSLDADTGEVLWRQTLWDDGRTDGWHVAALTGCSVVVRDSSGLAGLDPTSGAENWRTGGEIYWPGTDGRAVYGLAGPTENPRDKAGGSLVKHDAQTGRTVWTFDPERDPYSTHPYGPAVGPRYVYLAVRGGPERDYVSAVDRESGTEAWRVRLPVPEAPPSVSTPLRPESLSTVGFTVLSGGRLYVRRYDHEHDLPFLYALG
jgi:outer membrane protein assembly factor BamB